jgi:hypothetical protein
VQVSPVTVERLAFVTVKLCVLYPPMSMLPNSMRIPDKSIFWFASIVIAVCPELDPAPRQISKAKSRRHRVILKSFMIVGRLEKVGQRLDNQCSMHSLIVFGIS